jgi:glycyl-tRNA synthetase
MFLALLSSSLIIETLEDGSERTVLNLPPALSPYKVAVLPLIKKDGLPEKARKIVDDLKFEFNCQYDEKDAIGRRYRRQDAIGTPYCVTVDHETLTDNKVTIRNRDTMHQDRVLIEKVKETLKENVSITNLLHNL